MGTRGLGRGLVLAAWMAVAAGCASPAPAPPVAPVAAPEPEPVVEAAPAPLREDSDLCQARDLQWLVGNPRTEIPVPVDVVNRRVACTTCPVTEDYSPYRLNIFYDRETGIISEVRCG